MTATHTPVIEAPASLEELWMPFTSNKAFKQAPRLLGAAQGMYYTSSDGRSILDGAADCASDRSVRWGAVAYKLRPN